MLPLKLRRPGEVLTLAVPSRVAPSRPPWVSPSFDLTCATPPATVTHRSSHDLQEGTVGSMKPVSLAVLTCLLTTATMAQERLPTISPDQYTAEQKKAAEDFLAARKVPVFGPFEPLMYSPEVMCEIETAVPWTRVPSASTTA